MPRYPAQWTNTESDDFEGGDLLEVAAIGNNFGKNVEYLKAQVDTLLADASATVSANAAAAARGRGLFD